MTGGRWTITLNDKPMLENEHRTLHRYDRARYDRRWRDWACLEARAAHLPRRLAAVTIDVIHERPNRRSLPDPGNCAPTAKAAIDGLVDYGLITDDGPDWVDWIRYSVRITGRHALSLIINEVDP
jgi:hypothetical protein